MRQIIPKVIQALQHPDYWVRHSAAQLLERLKGQSGATPESKPFAAPKRATEPNRPHPATPVLAEMLSDRDRDFRLAAASALGLLREQSAAAILTAAMQDQDFSVRLAAQAALMALN